MRIDKFWIEEFKNLKDFKIDFDEGQMTTVLIGRNGTGKSNLIEAIVIAFRDLDLGKPPAFSYDLSYICRGHKIRIIADYKNKPNYKISIDGESTSTKKFIEESDRKYMPKYVFAYYSGPSIRLESHFEPHQERFYKELLHEKDKPLRPFFYARLIHSQFVLLSYFSFEDEISKQFLNEYLNISGLESVLFILKKPQWGTEEDKPWKSKEGDKRFWNAKGVVQQFLSELYRHSLAPIRSIQTITEGYKSQRRLEHLYLFIPSEEILKKLAKIYGNNTEFFKVLESMYISELIKEVRIKVKIKNTDGFLTFRELSEGEQQLLTVLGLLKFTQDEESLFLLDEPDTHLNPIWKLKYLDLLENVVGREETSHLIICTHDPLVIGGLQKSQVQIFEKNEDGKIITHSPDLDPKGMGVAALLTSELFGLKTTLDRKTQDQLDRKRELFLKSQQVKLNENEEMEMQTLSDELGSLDFTRTIRDPLYDKFVRAIMNRNEFKKPILSASDKREQERIAQEIVNEILEEEKK